MTSFKPVSSLGIYRAQNQLSMTHGNFCRRVLLRDQPNAQFIASLHSAPEEHWYKG